MDNDLWVIFLWYIIGMMIGWLRNWGGVALVSSITIFGFSFTELLSCTWAITMRVIAGIAFLIASFMCFRDFRIARAKDKEEKSRSLEGGIQPYISPPPDKKGDK